MRQKVPGLSQILEITTIYSLVSYRFSMESLGRRMRAVPVPNRESHIETGLFRKLTIMFGTLAATSKLRVETYVHFSYGVSSFASSAANSGHEGKRCR